MRKTINKIILTAFILWFFGTGTVFSQEEIEYKKFKLEDASCDVGVSYKKMPQGILVGVSAIATGKGAEFRKWSVSGIKLNISGERLMPDKEGKFYVAEESFFRVPAAIVFVAIGALGEYSNNNFENAIGKIGVGLGLGLIALQAKGEITGERSLFRIPNELAGKIKEGTDTIEIAIENQGQHLKCQIRIGLIIPTGDTIAGFNFDKISSPELLKRVDTLKGKIVSLEAEQADYKYGQDPEYDNIQKKIEALETERGVAYKTWLEKQNKL